MNDIYKSIINVTQSPFFFVYMSLIITFGMWIGREIDDGLRGFKRSITIILPFIFIVVLANVSRIYQASFITPLTTNAFNGTVSAIITSMFYIVGLFVGHMISYKAKEQVLKNI